MTLVTEHICRKQLTLRKPHTSSPATTQWSKILLEWPRTCSGRIVKRPGHLKDDVTWTLATEHRTLTLLLAFEYLLLTTWGYCYWTYTLENLRDIFRITHANTCSWTLALSIYVCIRVFDIELMLLGMINSHFPFLWFNSDLVLNSFSFVLVLYIFFFFILGRMWHVAQLFIMSVISPM